MSFKSETFEVTGLDELTAQLGRLEAWAESDVMKGAMKDSMEIIAEEAKNLAPRKTGQLIRAIRVRMGKVKHGGYSVLAAVGKKWFAGDEFYGAFQEFGWKAGSRKKGDRKQIEGEHYMQYAFDEKKQEAADRFIESAKSLLAAELNK